MRFFCCLLALVFVPATVPARQGGKEAVPTIEPVARLGSACFRQGEPVSAVCFSPDGKTLASAGISNTLYLWDAATGKLLRRTPPASGRGAPTEISISADNQQLLAISLSQLNVWDLTLKGPTAQLKVPSSQTLLALAVAPEGTVLTAGYDKTITRWDPKSGEPLRNFTKHQGVVYALVLSRKGDTFFSASEDKTVRRWDLATGKGSVVLDNLSQPVRCLALSPDASTLYTAGPKQPVQVWDAATGKLLQQHTNVKEEIKRLALSPDGNILLALDMTGHLFVWEKPGGKASSWKVPRLGSAGGMAFSPDGKRLALGGKDLYVLDVDKGTAAPDGVGHWGPVAHVTFAPGGQALASSGWDRTLRLWGLPKGEQLRVIAWPTSFSPILVRYTADGKNLLAVSAQGAAVLLDATEGKPVKDLVKHPGGLRGQRYRATDAGWPAAPWARRSSSGMPSAARSNGAGRSVPCRWICSFCPITRPWRSATSPARSCSWTWKRAGNWSAWDLSSISSRKWHRIREADTWRSWKRTGPGPPTRWL
jgi:WD40 repeat protein